MRDVAGGDTDREGRPVVMLFDGWDFVPIEIKPSAPKPDSPAESAQQNSKDAGTSR